MEPSGPGTILLLADGLWVFYTWDLAPSGQYRAVRERGSVTALTNRTVSFLPAQGPLEELLSGPRAAAEALQNKTPG